ncbi:hypothetical protein GGR53DRAFT_48837 [Hypoxylon sp. FL1150]|nr:hypothetical protein GGR53DRAFT_48837 [Hypoxylon sp. FL1150]
MGDDKMMVRNPIKWRSVLSRGSRSSVRAQLRYRFRQFCLVCFCLLASLHGVPPILGHPHLIPLSLCPLLTLYTILSYSTILPLIVPIIRSVPPSPLYLFARPPCNPSAQVSIRLSVYYGRSIRGYRLR